MHGGSGIHSLEPNRAKLLQESTSYFPESGQEWFTGAVQALTDSSQIDSDLGLYSAMAKRKLGVDRFQDSAPVDTRYYPLDIRRWTSAEIARQILLMTAVERQPGQAEEIINTYYRVGDESEHIALVRGLIFFAPGDYLTQIALDAGRTNNLELLAAITLDNPYPACFFSQEQFNQMVLKALFQGLAIERVQGLAQRANPDLARMAESYVVEREKAGRSVPTDIWLAIAPFASETGRQQLIDYLAHEDAGHRYYCALGLTHRLSQDSSLLPVLRQRLETEPETMVLKLLQDALAP